MKLVGGAADAGLTGVGGSLLGPPFGEVGDGSRKLVDAILGIP